MKKWYKECPYCWEEIKEIAKKCRFCWEFLERNTNTIKEYSNKNSFSFKKLKNNNWKNFKYVEKITFSQRLLYFIPNVILLRISFSVCYAFIWVMHDLISRGNWIRKVPVYMSGFSFLFGVSVVIWILGVICTTKKRLYSWTVKASILCFIFSFIVYCARVNTFEEDKKNQQLMLQRQQRMLQEQTCKEQWYTSCHERDLKIRQIEKEFIIK